MAALTNGEVLRPSLQPNTGAVTSPSPPGGSVEVGEAWKPLDLRNSYGYAGGSPSIVHSDTFVGLAITQSEPGEWTFEWTECPGGSSNAQNMSQVQYPIRDVLGDVLTPGAALQVRMTLLENNSGAFGVGALSAIHYGTPGEAGGSALVGHSVLPGYSGNTSAALAVTRNTTSGNLYSVMLSPAAGSSCVRTHLPRQGTSRLDAWCRLEVFGADGALVTEQGAGGLDTVDPEDALLCICLGTRFIVYPGTHQQRYRVEYRTKRM